MVGRLVEEEDVRLFEQQPAQFQPRLFSAAHIGDLLSVHIAEPHAVENGADAHVCMVSVLSGDPSVQLLVAGRQGAECVAPFLRRRHLCGDLPLGVHGALYVRKNRLHLFVDGARALQPAVLFKVTDLQPALFEDFSFVGRQCAGHQFEQRRFAFAVRADQSDAFTFRYGKADVFEDALVIVAEAHVFQSQ